MSRWNPSTPGSDQYHRVMPSMFTVRKVRSANPAIPARWKYASPSKLFAASTTTQAVAEASTEAPRLAYHEIPGSREERRRHDVGQQDGVVQQRLGPEHREQRRQREVRPVVGQRLGRQVGIDRGRRPLRQLAHHAHVGEEVGDEVRAECQAVRRRLPHPREDRPDDGRGDQPQEAEGGQVAPLEPGQLNDAGAAPRHDAIEDGRERQRAAKQANGDAMPAARSDTTSRAPAR